MLRIRKFFEKTYEGARRMQLHGLPNVHRTGPEGNAIRNAGRTPWGIATKAVTARPVPRGGRR